MIMIPNSHHWWLLKTKWSWSQILITGGCWKQSDHDPKFSSLVAIENKVIMKPNSHHWWLLKTKWSWSQILITGGYWKQSDHEAKFSSLVAAENKVIMMPTSHHWWHHDSSLVSILLLTENLFRNILKENLIFIEGLFWKKISYFIEGLLHSSTCCSYLSSWLVYYTNGFVLQWCINLIVLLDFNSHSICGKINYVLIFFTCIYIEIISNTFIRSYRWFSARLQ